MLFKSKNLLFLMCLSLTVFMSCEKTSEDQKVQLTPSADLELQKLLSNYPSTMTAENYLEFVDAPAAVLEYFEAQEAKVTKPSTNSPLSPLQKEEVLRQWGVNDTPAGERVPCNCDFITAIVPNWSFAPDSWTGGMMADLNDSGTISVSDMVVMIRIILNYDTNGDDAITGFNEILNGTPAQYDYDRNGVIDADDSWAAALYSWQLSNISPVNSSFDRDDIDCVRDYILGIFLCD